MTAYRVEVFSDRYPLTFDVEATNFATATARAIRLWQKRFKGMHASTIRTRTVKI